jgi:dihydroorotate dehydrogenase (NAD+) catalytic subunit
MKTEVRIGNCTFRNPVFAASGTFGYGEEYADIVALSKLGGVVTKGITLEPREGNPPPRIVETASGMLNAIGLQNVGVRRFIEEKLPFYRDNDVPCIVNIAGKKPQEYSELAKALDKADGVCAIEVNVSCPNVESGLDFAVDPKGLHDVVERVKKETSLTTIIKLSPNVTDIVAMAKSAVDAGADALSLINTLVGMAVDVRTRRPKIANVTAGLSGPAIKPVGIRMVHIVAKAVDVPIIGMGGIASAEDAIEYILVGATAVQVGTAIFYDPSVLEEIADGITRYMEENGIDSLQNLVGAAEIPKRPS